MKRPSRPTWDIFCRVIDNFGDIGVCWRFARQLAAEHELPVRLWVDDLATFQRINAAIDPALDAQSSCGIEVRRWTDPFPAVSPADVVVETFGCEAPESYQVAMAGMEKKPVWLNLEYLSAESWVSECHRLPSPHPRLPLTRYFFFPGFSSATGGLLRESDLIQARDAFRANPDAINAFWKALALPPSGSLETRVSLFSYENPAIADLFATWAMGGEPVLCLAPEGRTGGDIKAFFAQSAAHDSNTYRQGNLTVRILPFLEPSNYDRLLWACDFNIVRGEDSFVRAQWAGAPFAWHIYPQKENAHWVKLNAFIDHYCADMTPEAAAGLRAFWRAWNSGRGAGQAWSDFWRCRAALEAHSNQWAEHLIGLGDLASNMVSFAENLLER